MSISGLTCDPYFSTATSELDANILAFTYAHYDLSNEVSNIEI